jgi:hypothetical protein
MNNGVIYTILAKAVNAALGIRPVQLLPEPLGPGRRFTSGRGHGPSNHYYLPRALRVARRKQERRNRHAAQRRLRIAA